MVLGNYISKQDLGTLDHELVGVLGTGSLIGREHANFVAAVYLFYTHLIADLKMGDVVESLLVEVADSIF